jgi:hypothetical protein
MAKFCLSTGFEPKVFWGLTYQEYNAILEEYNRRNG